MTDWFGIGNPLAGRPQFEGPSILKGCAHAVAFPFENLAQKFSGLRIVRLRGDQRSEPPLGVSPLPGLDIDAELFRRREDRCLLTLSRRR